MNVSYMKEYLKYACEFERYVYIWRQALNCVNGSISQIRGRKSSVQSAVVDKETLYSRIEQDVKTERESEKKNTKANSFFYIPLGILFLVLCYGAPFLIGASEEAKTKGVSFMEGLKMYADKSLGGFGLILVIAVASIFIISLVVSLVMGIITFVNKDKQGYWGKEIKKRKIAADNKQQQLKETLAAYSNSERLLLEEKSTIMNNLRKAEEALSSLYAQNVLHEKYRNMVAVATMYEYLCTGRCTQIEGHGGIIDTFEYDLKLGLIIKNLTEINQKLDIVMENQHLLYGQLQEANMRLGSIESGIKQIETHTANIEKNTAISAVANQQTAAIAKSMEWRAWANGY